MIKKGIGHEGQAKKSWSGASSPAEIDVMPVDEGSWGYRDKVVEFLRKG